MGNVTRCKQSAAFYKVILMLLGKPFHHNFCMVSALVDFVLYIFCLKILTLCPHCLDFLQVESSKHIYILNKGEHIISNSLTPLKNIS